MAILKLSPSERSRIDFDYRRNMFLDVCTDKDLLNISIDLYPTMQYIEIRKKNGVLRVFVFEKKGHKKHFDFAYWQDAEVVFSVNEVNKPQ